MPERSAHNKQPRRSVWARVAVAATIAFAGLAGCTPNSTTDESLNRDFSVEIRALLADYAAEGAPGAAVRVLQAGDVLHTGTFGLAHVGDGTPITASTNFRLASVTKQFTAASILLLAEDGLLDLGTTLPDLFPDFPSYGSRITVKHLLQHTSGLLDYEPMVPSGAEPVHDKDVLRLMTQADHTYFEPGAEFRYSNSGYAVLAMIVTRLSGVSFATFLRDRIFEPVGMQNSVAFEEGISMIPNRAYGYTVEDDWVVLSDQSRWSAVLGDGGMYSSLEDLTLWDEMQYTDRLLSAESRALMETPGLDSYGFGIRIDTYKGHRRLHHSGSTSGFRNYMVRFPDLELTVILLTNRADPSVSGLAERIVDLFLP